MDIPDLDALPGFRRRFVVTPGPDAVVSAVEDDYHCMAVRLRHDGVSVVEVEALMDRAPWTTCPGAMAVLQQTFVGATLAEAAALGRKTDNCTHLYDLAVLAAAHAGDTAPLTYDIVVCDPVDRLVAAEIRREGSTILRFEHREHVMVSPAEIAGLSLLKLREWIGGLGEVEREAARLLQWGTILANGRTYPMELQSDAARMPPNCFTFQPHNSKSARRVGKVINLSQEQRAPLAYFDAVEFAYR